jgi:hypothetical protein
VKEHAGSTTEKYDVAYAYAYAQAPQDPSGLWADFALAYSRLLHKKSDSVHDAWAMWE